MDGFEANFQALSDQDRRQKLDNILGFLRQHNAVPQADAFQELRNCYPTFLPFPTEERKLRELVAWTKIASHLKHPAVRQIVQQG
uniref:Uncharacterized protein n=1 Tax=viral metagenome TaxID=1070528 RepID=A0A6C0J551_9ZZZZ